MNETIVSGSPTLGLSVVVPCFNEEQRLAATIKDMREKIPGVIAATFEIILVDDGSTDDTARIAEQLVAESAGCVRTIRLAVNSGKGAAVRAGVAACRAAAVLMADADGSTPIAELGRLLPELSNGADIVIGSRALTDSGVTLKTKLYRKILGRLFNAVVNLLVLPGIRDTQCGFKLFSRRVALELFPKLSVNHFGFDIEFLMTARLRGFTVREVAVNWHHVPGSKVNLVSDSLRMLAMVVRLFIREQLTRNR